MDRTAFEAAFLRFLDGEMPAEEQRALARTIQEDRALQVVAARLGRIHGNLAVVLGEEAAAARLSAPEKVLRISGRSLPAPMGGVRFPAARRLQGWVAVLVAGLLVGLTGLFLFLGGDRKGLERQAQDRPLGRVLFASGNSADPGARPVLVREARTSPLVEGQDLYTHDRIITAARVPQGGPREDRPAQASVELANGAQIDLADATEMSLLSEGARPRVDLHAGLIYAHAAALRDPLILQTANCALETEDGRFELEAAEGHSRLRLVQGSVSLTQASTAPDRLDAPAEVLARPGDLQIAHAPNLTGLWRGRATPAPGTLLKEWTFQAGAPPDMAVAYGAWEPEHGAGARPGMRAVSVGLLCDLELPDSFLMEIEAVRLNPAGFAAVFRSNAEAPARVATWKAPPGQVSAASRTRIRWYFAGRWAVHEDGGALRTVHKYPYEVPRQILLTFSQLQVERIVLRELAPADLPVPYRTPEELVQGLKPLDLHKKAP